MEVNTHGMEEEENEHAIERRVYMDITPRPKQSKIVISLKNQAGEEWQSRCTEHFAWKAANHIIELEKKIEFYESLLHKYHLDTVKRFNDYNDAFTGKGNMDGTTLQNKFTK